jgi:ferrous iron transport protein A
MSLDNSIVNQKVKVCDICGGWGIRQRLNQLGVHVGDIVMVKRSGMLGGPILIHVHDTDVAIGRGMARKILVEPIKSEITKE